MKKLIFSLFVSLIPSFGVAGIHIMQDDDYSKINLLTQSSATATYQPIGSYLDTSSATATYIQLSSASATYLPISSATASYMTTSLGLTQSSATATYLQASSAPLTYLQLSSATATYLKKSEGVALVSTQTFTGQITFQSTITVKNVPSIYVLAADSTTIGQGIALSPISFPVLAGSTYYIDCFLLFQSTAITNGIALGIAVPAGPATISYVAQIPLAAADSAASEWQGYGTASDDMVIGTGVQAKDTTYVARLFGALQNGTSDGNLGVSFRAELASPGQVVLKAGSLCQLLSNPG